MNVSVCVDGRQGVIDCARALVRSLEGLDGAEARQVMDVFTNDGGSIPIIEPSPQAMIVIAAVRHTVAHMIASEVA